jgi:hypothetical protein
MSQLAPPSDAALAERLARNSDGIVEQIAADAGLSPFDVIRHLPATQHLIVDGDRFEAIMARLTTWGDVLLIVHTKDIVLEVVGAIPPGQWGRGYFNLHGDSPIGGHFRGRNCTHIALVSRPFMGRPSRSIQFFNVDGEAMFKVFVRRDENRDLRADQLALFDALEAELRAEAMRAAATVPANG